MEGLLLLTRRRTTHKQLLWCSIWKVKYQ